MRRYFVEFADGYVLSMWATDFEQAEAKASRSYPEHVRVTSSRNWD